MTDLPPLKEDYPWFIDELIPDLVQAHSGIHSGDPCVAGTRIPTSTIWGHHEAGDPFSLLTRAYDLSPEQLLAAYAFQKGIEWQQSRKRRNRMWDAVRLSHKMYMMSYGVGRPGQDSALLWDEEHYEEEDDA